MPDEGGVVDVLTSRLADAGADVLTLKRTAPVGALETQLAKWTESGPIDGVYWLPGLDLEGPVAKLSPAARRDALHVRVKLLAAAMRGLPESTFLVSATRLGGRHGYDEAGSLGVLGGAVTGFTKALGRERADTLIKAVDFGTDGSGRRGASSRRRCLTRPRSTRERSRSGTPTTCGGRLRSWSARPSMTPAASPTRTPCSSSPAPLEASSPRS